MKTVLITGGSGGIGGATVKLFAEKGYDVIFTYNTRTEEAANLATATGSRAFKCDLRSYKDIEALKEAVGRVDVLINNAGVSLIKLLIDYSAEEIDELLSVDLRGAILVTKAFLPKMLSMRYGRIINVGSMWGTSGAASETVYSAAKAGIAGFTRALAKETALSGVTVNAVAPGFISTPMNSCLSEEACLSVVNETPVGRAGTPEEVASAVLFLASDDASFITGAVIPVDGGFTA